MLTTTAPTSFPAPAVLHPAVFAAGGLAGAALAVALPAPVAAVALALVALRVGVMFASTSAAGARR